MNRTAKAMGVIGVLLVFASTAKAQGTLPPRIGDRIREGQRVTSVKSETTAPLVLLPVRVYCPHRGAPCP